ncbi:MAG: hypothetical protein R6X20_00105 [Phycisphaerae bacterium]
MTALNGNVWVARGGFYRTRFSTRLKGDKHTFFLNDQPPLTPESDGVEVVRGGYIIRQEHPGPGYDGYCVAQYLRVRKSDDASVEFVGTVTSSDDFQLFKGEVIVAESSRSRSPGRRAPTAARAMVRNSPATESVEGDVSRTTQRRRPSSSEPRSWMAAVSAGRWSGPKTRS